MLSWCFWLWVSTIVAPSSSNTQTRRSSAIITMFQTVPDAADLVECFYANLGIWVFAFTLVYLHSAREWLLLFRFHMTMERAQRFILSHPPLSSVTPAVFCHGTVSVNIYIILLRCARYSLLSSFLLLHRSFQLLRRPSPNSGHRCQGTPESLTVARISNIFCHKIRCGVHICIYWSLCRFVPHSPDFRLGTEKHTWPLLRY